MDKSQYLQPREYEMLAVLLPDQGDEETQAAIDKMISYITDENGTIDSVNAESPWGRRRLAYTIRHEGVDYRDGHYVLAYFTVMPSAITEIERELKLDTNVVRYLILIHDPEMGEQIDESAIAAEGEDAQAEETATEETSEEETVVDEASAEEAVAEEAPVEETVADEAPAEETVAEETSSEEAGTEATSEEEVAEVETDSEETAEEASEESEDE